MFPKYSDFTEQEKRILDYVYALSYMTGSKKYSAEESIRTADLAVSDLRREISEREY